MLLGTVFGAESQNHELALTGALGLILQQNSEARYPATPLVSGIDQKAGILVLE